MGETIQIESEAGTFDAYLARPVKTPAPTVVVIQEIFGINADLRATCDELAAQGYLALCPDLFWRQQRNVQLTDQTPDEWKQAMALHDGFDLDAGVRDLEDTVQAARDLEGSTGMVATLGFCLGGLLSYMTAVRTEVDAAVVYYGGGMDQHLDEGTNLGKPLLVHLGEADEYIDADARAAIAGEFSDNPLAEVFTYPGQAHAFARHNGVHYDAASAKLANSRTAAFLKANLHHTVHHG